MASAIASFDWASTPIGSIEQWPQCLKTIIGFLVRSSVPIVLLWGPEGVMIYNDAYSGFAGARHPEQLGKTVRQGWPEVADFNDNVMKVGLAGGSLAYKDQELTLYRSGMPEQVWLDLDYSPVLDEIGQPAGVIALVVETTQRVLAGRKLAAEQERQRELLRQMPGFIGVLTGPEHVYQYVNDAYVRISERADFVGRKFREVFPDLAGQGFDDLLDKVYSSGTGIVTRGMELRLRGSPELQFVDFVFEPIRDDDGAVTGVFIGGYEVTEAHRATAALRASEEQLRLATENAEIGLWDVDVRNDKLFWQPRVKAMFGISADEPVSMADFYAGLHPDDRAVTADAYARAADPDVRAVYDVEYRTVGKADGTVRWVAAKGRGVFDMQGNCVRMIGTALDVTARKTVEQRLHDLNENLERQVIERTQARGRTWQFSPDLMGALDRRGHFETSNPAWRTVLGWSEQEIASMSIFDLVHPDDLERTRAGFELAQQGQPTIRFPNRYRHKAGGYRWISWVGVPEDGMVYCTGRDITDEKAAEAELATVQEALRQSQKMEAIGQLTGGIAHDFNNLLAGISGSLELLERRFARGQLTGIERYIDTAQGSARRAAILTQRLLAFSRRQTLDPKPTNANSLIDGVEDLIRRTIGPGIALELQGSPELWLTRIDPSQLENALVNLSINARDAMPDGGLITIGTANQDLDERATRSLDIAPGEYISISFTDTGTGMPPGVIARAFDPFFTTKPLGQGTGLGLSMIQGFVLQSCGQVRIRSEEGKGTTIDLYLPRFFGQEENNEITAEPLAAKSGKGEAILVVDDEAAVRSLMVEELEEAGYAVLGAADGASGLKILQSGARVDLLVTDVGLPGGMNGRQLADAARVSRPELKVLFVTGYAEHSVIGDGLLGVGMVVIAKPFAMTAFANKVRETIENIDGGR